MVASSFGSFCVCDRKIEECRYLTCEMIPFVHNQKQFTRWDVLPPRDAKGSMDAISVPKLVSLICKSTREPV